MPQAEDAPIWPSLSVYLRVRASNSLRKMTASSQLCRSRPSALFGMVVLLGATWSIQVVAISSQARASSGRLRWVSAMANQSQVTTALPGWRSAFRLSLRSGSASSGLPSRHARAPRSASAQCALGFFINSSFAFAAGTEKSLTEPGASVHARAACRCADTHARGDGV